jgi:pyridoxal 5'-phosphate synthase pdxT subunit
VVFIRAPRISRLGAGVAVLARHGRDPVLVRQGNILAATFHPEMGQDRTLHRLLAGLAAQAEAAATV